MATRKTNLRRPDPQHKQIHTVFRLCEWFSSCESIEESNSNTSENIYGSIRHVVEGDVGVHAGKGDPPLAKAEDFSCHKVLVDRF